MLFYSSIYIRNILLIYCKVHMHDNETKWHPWLDSQQPNWSHDLCLQIASALV